MKDDTFVIGDVHGHFDRLQSLLLQEGLIDGADNCLRPDVKIVQLGDLGHFGLDWNYSKPTPKSPSADLWAYQLADKVIDVVLWGNHDRAVKDAHHHFGGYTPPLRETEELMKLMMHSGKLKLADAAHGFLLTHAGLHKQFKYNKVPDEWKTDPEAFVKAINTFDRLDRHATKDQDIALQAIRDAIGSRRGGGSPHGGIIWRDASEKLFGGYRQIFGHSKGKKVRKYQTPDGYSYCIDLGSPTNGKLVGMWLPSETIAEVTIPKNHVITPAEAVSTHWNTDTMPKTMERLA